MRSATLSLLRAGKVSSRSPGSHFFLPPGLSAAMVGFFSAASERSHSRSPPQREHLDAEKYLQSLVNYEVQGVPTGAGTASKEGFELARMKLLMKHLGNPIHKYKVVHVAGSKGKGSTVAFLSAMLRCAGIRTGTYTSPHVSHLRERILGPAGDPISVAAFDALLKRHMAGLESAQREAAGALTHFEVLTGLAYAHFAEEQVDVAVIETGLGGVRDATNVVPPESLAAAVITSVGREHWTALGGSMAAIAAAKAGIMKPGTPVVVAAQAEEVAEDVLRATARALNAPLLPTIAPLVAHACGRPSLDSSGASQTCRFEIDGAAAAVILRTQTPGAGEGGGHSPTNAQTLHQDKAAIQMERGRERLEDVRMAMVGGHQAHNAAAALLAATCLRLQGYDIPHSALRAGLEQAHLPGRFQVLSAAQAAALGAPGRTIIVDGAHTGASGKALAETLTDACNGRHVALVVAMASDKDHSAFASALLRHCKGLETTVLTQVSIAGSSARSAPVAVLRQAWEESRQQLLSESTDFAEARGCRIEEAAGVIEAVSSAVESGGPECVLCITGSLHAVAAVLHHADQLRS